jgi:AbrB family looped-hinge helix DNA binding protein
MRDLTGTDQLSRKDHHDGWYISTMRSTIDPAGRLVIPKSIRDRLGLTGGQVVEIQERDGRIEIQAAPTPMSLVDQEGGPVAVPEEDLPPLTDDIVRTTIERTRR